MYFFSFLWIPLVYVLWRAVNKEVFYAGGVWALVFGSIVAMAQFFYGPLMEAGDFGITRWISGFVDVVTVPALLPFFVYLILAGLRKMRSAELRLTRPDIANFSLLWLIPYAAIRALSWDTLSDPILMVLIPVLLSSIALGLSFSIGLYARRRPIPAILATLNILVILPATATSYWAFFAHDTAMGFIFLFTAAAPMLFYMIMLFILADRENSPLIRHSPQNPEH
jgi:hypothetical protein